MVPRINGSVASCLGLDGTASCPDSASGMDLDSVCGRRYVVDHRMKGSIIMQATFRSYGSFKQRSAYHRTST
jgi:hypothetical protein